MALLQVYKNDELEYIGFSHLSICDYLQSCSIEYKHLEDIDLINPSKLYEMDNFIRHDIIQILESMDLNFHYHEDDEARIIIDGEVIFKFIRGERRIDLKVSRGSYISIPKGIVHTAIIKEPVKVLRLFTTIDNYKAIPV